MSKLKTFAEKLFSVDGMIKVTALCLALSITLHMLNGERERMNIECLWMWILFVYWEVRRLGDKIKDKHK